ncbi:hypothetical protein [Winogradskyella aquimaris]|uniref:Uncharacterized protein n=1 Tax=Winogradskyella aquimaris TaxID=864074 RepID=A0ABU5EPZ6_9FLAO|nr:hypothetical protein [Winogradskyella aquimaris]MDY2588323.1 hypothetical protein [Winogradskyella aquimaris]
MKIKFLTIILLSSLLGFSQEKEFKNLEDLRQQQIENISNSDLWDMGRLEGDVISQNNNFPITFGAYPVPNYDELGPYKGGGLIGNAQARSLDDYKLMVKDKEVVFNSFFIGDSPFYEEKNKNRVFFTIITVADSLDSNNFVPSKSLFLSRNHPDYGGEGSITTKTSTIDFVTFTTPDKGSFAIVNMRLFHLEYGAIILIEPQKDGSLRSLQIEGKIVNNEEIYDFLKDTILKREDVVQFFTDDTE